MYIALVIIIAAIFSLGIGFSFEQAYGQTNMTETKGMNMTETPAANTTTSSNMTGTEDVNATNATKGNVSWGSGAGGGI